GGLRAEAGADFDTCCKPDCVFDVGVREQSAPPEFGRSRSVGIRLDSACEERGERGKGRLAVLVLRKIIVRLQTLKPDSGFDLMFADGIENVVVKGIESSSDGVIRANIRPGSGD